jgi:ABC-type uncharacterized transport system substrate-binding protein
MTNGPATEAQMQRRKFVRLLGSAAAAWPFAARAQQGRVPVIGFIDARQPDTLIAPFHQGLKDAGYIEGQNLTVEYRWGANNLFRQREFAADLARRDVAAIFASPDGPAVAAKAATSTIPIVAVLGSVDPVKLGLVASLNRPGGNLTGIASNGAALWGKRIDLLCELVPQVKTIGYLSGGAGYLSYEDEKNQISLATRALGRELIIEECNNGGHIDSAFATLIQRGAGSLIVAAIPLFVANSQKIVGLAAQYRLPAMYPVRVYPAGGGLMSYSPDAADAHRLAAGLLGRILRGAKAADLPVMLPTKFEFVINQTTAKRLDIEIPRTLLAFASELIE